MRNDACTYLYLRKTYPEDGPIKSVVHAWQAVTPEVFVRDLLGGWYVHVAALFHGTACILHDQLLQSWTGTKAARST